MGWSIRYRIVCEREWSEADRRRLTEHVQKWGEKLSPHSDGYNVQGMAAERDFHGRTKPPPSRAAASDYVNLVRALQELEELFPEAEVFISDDGEIYTDARPDEIDLESLRERMLEEFGAEKDELEDQEELEEDLRALTELERARAEAKPLLEKAARDFEIWKRAQQKKQGGS